MSRLGVLLLCIGSLSAVQVAHAADQCGPETGIQLSGTADAPWTMQIQLNPKDVPLNAPFDATVTVCSQLERLPSRVTVDATMPVHKHGMNYEPKMERVERRQYQVKNLLFHMPGVWRLEVTAYENDKTYRFTHDVALQ